MNFTRLLDDNENQNFHQIDLGDQDLSGKNFADCHFDSVKFPGTKLYKVRFQNCVFINCDLSNVMVKDCRFQDVFFDGCKMLGIDFTACDQFLLSLSFKNCHLNLCNFTGLKLKGTSFKKCQIRDADFVEADLSKADFSGCDLKGSLFNKNDLRAANFCDASHYLINPLNNKLEKACFSLPEALSLLSAFGIKIR